MKNYVIYKKVINYRQKLHKKFKIKKIKLTLIGWIKKNRKML